MRSAAARRVVWFLAIVTGMVGLYVSFHLVGEHYRFPTAGVEQDKSLLDEACTAFPTSDCGKVIKQSRWGVFPPREVDEQGKIIQPKEGAPDISIPTAELGMYYWTAILIWLFVIGVPTPDRAWVQAIFFLVTCLGLGFCAFLAYVMFFGKGPDGQGLEAWCPLCSLTHICGLVLVILAVLMWPRIAPDAVAPAKESPPASAAKESDSLFGSQPEKERSPTALLATAGASRSWPPTYLLGMVVFISLIAMFGERSFTLAKERNYKLKAAQLQRDRYEVYYKEYARDFNHGYIAWLTFPAMKIDLEGVPVRGEENAQHEVVSSAISSARHVPTSRRCLKRSSVRFSRSWAASKPISSIGRSAPSAIRRQ